MSFEMANKEENDSNFPDLVKTLEYIDIVSL